MIGPVILGYDYGLLLELVAMGYVENALQKANPYKKKLTNLKRNRPYFYWSYYTCHAVFTL